MRKQYLCALSRHRGVETSNIACLAVLSACADTAGLLQSPHRPLPVQAAHRARPDKHRKQARAFKELDTTLQVLGIDGGQGDKRGLRITASVHAPVQPEAVRTPRRSSRTSLAEGELR